MSTPAPQLKVSKTSLRVSHKDVVTKQQNQNHLGNAKYTKGGRKRKKGGSRPVPTLAISSGPPASSPSAHENMVNAHKHNAALVAAAANDSKVAKPKCASTQSGGGSRLGNFMESLHNIQGGKRRKRRTQRKKKHHRKSRHRTLRRRTRWRHTKRRQRQRHRRRQRSRRRRHRRRRR